MNGSIWVLGEGGLAREMEGIIRAQALDSNTPKFGGFVSQADEEHLSRENRALIPGVGQPDIRLKMLARIHEWPSCTFASIRHPHTTIGDRVQVGAGVAIAAGCRLTCDIRVDDGVLLNLNVTVGHDTNIGAGVVVNPGVNISGNVSIGPGVLIGTGATILQGLSIGPGAVVGAGAVVTKDVDPGTTVTGVPAKPRLG